MWKSLPGCANKLQLEEFRSVEQIATSDHKPVYAKFNLELQPRVHLSPHSSQVIRLKLVDFHASDLLAMDMNGTSDPYVSVGLKVEA